MSSTSQAIQTPTSFTTVITKPITMATTVITAVSTIVSNVVTIIQSTPIPTPTATTTATTTGHLPEPSKQSNASSDSSESSSPAPRPWVAEPYYSGTSFIASVANILYMILYTLPLGWNHVMDILFYVQRRREALAKQKQEQKEREETRYHQIQQTNGINKMVELLGSVVQDNKGLKEENKVLSQRLESVETNSKALRQRVAGLESRLEGMEQEKMAKIQTFTAIQGLERAFRLGLEAVENRTRAVDHKVDWMLDYHLDENERFHTLRVILQGLLEHVSSASTTTSSNPDSSWGGEPVKNRIVVDESDWEENRKRWENK